jgi:GDPmannose 4,6-dehydratase
VQLPWQPYVEIDPRYQRPSEVDLLLGDAAKAREVLGWQPKTTFEELVALMVESDWELARSERWMQQRPATKAA